MKVFKKTILAVLVVMVVLQFFRPDKNIAQGDHTAVFLAETNPDDQVKVLLRESCYDCHSDHTTYPWYNNIAPVSFWLAHHIKEGKEHLNFSDWESYTVKEKDHKLEELIETVETGEMPLKEYTWTHQKAKLSKEGKEALMEWAKMTRPGYQLNERPQ